MAGGELIMLKRLVPMSLLVLWVNHLRAERVLSLLAWNCWHLHSCDFGQVVPSVHHFLKHFLFTRLRVGLVNFTDHFTSALVAQREEVSFCVEAAIRYWLVAFCAITLSCLWFNTSSNWGLQICLVSSIVEKRSVLHEWWLLLLRFRRQLRLLYWYFCYHRLVLLEVWPDWLKVLARGLQLLGRKDTTILVKAALRHWEIGVLELFNPAL